MADLLAWSSGLFMAGGAVWALIGALTVPMMDSKGGRSTLVFSSETDTKAFGATPREVLAGQPNVARLRAVLFSVVGGFLVVAGLLVVAVAWFAWRHGDPWAFGALTAAALLAIPFWAFAAKPFLDAGARVRFLDIPPFMWIPTILWIPAIAAGAAVLASP